MAGMTALAVVLFDLDDTLFDHRRAVERGITAHRRTLPPLGGEVPGDEAERDEAERIRWRELEELHYHRYLAGELDFLGQRRARVRDFVVPYGVDIPDDAAADAWWADYSAQYRSNWALHDDAIRCLDALGGRRVGLITNGDLAFQTTKIEAVGLHHRVEHVIASGETGVAKPDPRIFAEACRRFDTTPASAAYIGDRLHTDAIGAARAGLLGVWLDRLGIATDADRAAAAEHAVPIISTLDALPALLT
jgi:putative hydrolase of the HAD superfamily